MSDEQITPAQSKPDGAVETPTSHVEDVFYTSKRLHVSVRAILATLVVVVICEMQLLGMQVTEPLRDMGIFVLGFYFGSKGGPVRK